MEEFTYMLPEGRDALPFRQYLLPQLPGRASERLVGAVLGSCACGAAAFHCDGAAAVLDSLFVDPLVRGRGVGTALLHRCAAEAKALGAETLELSYALDGEELAAMDRLVRALGGRPVFQTPVYTVDIADYHSHGLLGPAFRYDYRQPAQIVLLSETDGELRAGLDENDEIPPFVRPAARPAADPALSVVWLEDGRPLAYLLGCESTRDEYTLLAAWRSPRAPSDAFHSLLLAQLHRCFYRSGGDYLYHFSAATPQSEALAQRYTGGVYRRREAHRARLRL